MRLWVVPIENSTEGAVNRSLDLLVDTELTIIAQVYLKIEHCLFSPSSLEKIVKSDPRIKHSPSVGNGYGETYPMPGSFL